ncbi:hypothetical protein G9A89_009380 [Geosiphon pyriformis]|nr:hypothetical protein G9A89_009380 [Geosiphon pyriformis]
MNSEFSDNELSGTAMSSSSGSFLSLAVITPKAKRVSSDLVSGSSIGTINFEIDENMVHFSLPLNISLNKKWVNSKVVKTQVEVPIKKFFALDINLLAVEKKLVMTKT